MDPMTIALIGGAVLGLMKSKEQQRNHQAMMKAEATKERWSPFTGQHGQNMMRPSEIDPIMQAMVAGAMLGQQFKKPAGQDPAPKTGSYSPGLGGATAPGGMTPNPY